MAQNIILHITWFYEVNATCVYKDISVVEQDSLLKPFERN